MLQLFTRLKRGLIHFRDQFSIDDLITCADVAERKAFHLEHSTETPADFLLFAAAYRLAQDPNDTEVVPLVRRIQRVSAGYDPSVRFCSQSRPSFLDDAQKGLFEAEQERILARHIGLFIQRYRNFSYALFQDYFPLSQEFHQKSLIGWVPNDELYVDL